MASARISCSDKIGKTFHEVSAAGKPIYIRTILNKKSHAFDKRLRSTHCDAGLTEPRMRQAHGLDAIRRAFEPVLRRVLHFYWRFSRGMTLGVRALVIDGEGRVFLVKHSYVSGWHLPGGGVEAGETLLDALARELREEGNIELTAPPALHGVFFNRPRLAPRSCRGLRGARNSARSRRRSPIARSSRTASLQLDALPDDTTAARARASSRCSPVLRSASTGKDRKGALAV